MPGPSPFRRRPCVAVLMPPSSMPPSSVVHATTVHATIVHPTTVHAAATHPAVITHPGGGGGGRADRRHGLGPGVGGTGFCSGSDGGVGFGPGPGIGLGLGSFGRRRLRRRVRLRGRLGGRLRRRRRPGVGGGFFESSSACAFAASRSAPRDALLRLELLQRLGAVLRRIVGGDAGERGGRIAGSLERLALASRAPGARPCASRSTRRGRRARRGRGWAGPAQAPSPRSGDGRGRRRRLRRGRAADAALGGRGLAQPPTRHRRAARLLDDATSTPRFANRPSHGRVPRGPLRALEEAGCRPTRSRGTGGPARRSSATGTKLQANAPMLISTFSPATS